MSSEMKEVASLVPQVFYDLIGRLVPGMALLSAAAVLLVDLGTGGSVPNLVTRMSGTAAILLGIAFAYLTGALLGAIGTAVIHRELTTKGMLGLTAEIPRRG